MRTEMFEKGEKPDPDEVSKRHAETVRVETAMKELKQKEKQLYRKFRLSGNYKVSKADSEEKRAGPTVNLAPMLGQNDMKFIATAQTKLP